MRVVRFIIKHLDVLVVSVIVALWWGSIIYRLQVPSVAPDAHLIVKEYIASTTEEWKWWIRCVEIPVAVIASAVCCCLWRRSWKLRKPSTECTAR